MIFDGIVLYDQTIKKEWANIQVPKPAGDISVVNGGSKGNPD